MSLNHRTPASGIPFVNTTSGKAAILRHCGRCPAAFSSATVCFIASEQGNRCRRPGLLRGSFSRAQAATKARVPAPALSCQRRNFGEPCIMNIAAVGIRNDQHLRLHQPQGKSGAAIRRNRIRCRIWPPCYSFGRGQRRNSDQYDPNLLKRRLPPGNSTPRQRPRPPPNADRQNLSRRNPQKNTPGFLCFPNTQIQRPQAPHAQICGKSSRNMPPPRR